MSVLGPSFQRAPRVSWTPAYEETFFRSLRDSVRKGLRDNTTGALKSEAWAQAAHDLRATHGVQLEKNHLKNKADNARKRFKAWRGLRDNPAFQYNETNATVAASDEAWEEHLQNDPSAKPLRGRSFEHEKYFELIFEDLLPHGMPRQRRRRLCDSSEGDVPGTSVVDLASEQQAPQQQSHQRNQEQPQQTTSSPPPQQQQHPVDGRYQAHGQSQPVSHSQPHMATHPHHMASRSHSPQWTRSPRSPTMAASTTVSTQKHSSVRPLAPALTPPHDPNQTAENARKRSLSADVAGSPPRRQRTDSWGHFNPQSQSSVLQESSSAMAGPSPVLAPEPPHSNSHYAHARAHPHPHPHPHHHHHRNHNHPRSMATPPSTVATTSPSPPASMPIASSAGSASGAGGLASMAAIEEMLVKIIDASKSQQPPPVSRWTEQAMDIFFSEFSHEDNDLQLMIAEKMLSVETTAMMFCKMSSELRFHWVKRMRAPPASAFRRT
ncbi:hypothetical protein BROUX41_004753 [Berkeleyomyces rouxiae]|uniref:uncharacterized protein n=1 Tax=Berkeleyomyces rouxiae TaxID=2035830 RepID=UPI003B808E70